MNGLCAIGEMYRWSNNANIMDDVDFNTLVVHWGLDEPMKPFKKYSDVSVSINYDIYASSIVHLKGSWANLGWVKPRLQSYLV